MNQAHTRIRPPTLSEGEDGGERDDDDEDDDEDDDDDDNLSDADAFEAADAAAAELTLVTARGGEIPFAIGAYLVLHHSILPMCIDSAHVHRFCRPPVPNRVGVHGFCHISGSNSALCSRLGINSVQQWHRKLVRMWHVKPTHWYCKARADVAREANTLAPSVASATLRITNPPA
jgi:hypothetical protein